MFIFSFEALGTKWEIGWEGGWESKNVNPKSVIKEVLAKIDHFDQIYSRFRKDSWVTHIQSGGKHPIPNDAKPLLDFYFRLYKLTHGSFTPLIGQMLVELGYDSDYSFKEKTVQSIEQWENVIFYEDRVLSLTKPTPLDFGAAGKGYLIDLISDFFISQHIFNYIIDAGGDILHADTRSTAIKVGLEHPIHTDEVIGTVNLHNLSICGSAGNRRKWNNYHHIVNPLSKNSPRNILASWVISNSTMIADGISTALFLVPAKQLLSLPEFEYLIVFDNYRIEKSSGFSADLFFA